MLLATLRAICTKSPELLGKVSNFAIEHKSSIFPWRVTFFVQMKWRPRVHFVTNITQIAQYCWERTI